MDISNNTSESAKRKRSDDHDDEDGNYDGHHSKQLNHAPLSMHERLQSDKHDKTKWTRLLLRELYDLGYSSAAACLEQESKVRVRSQAMDTLQTLVLGHRWDDALRFLQQHEMVSIKQEHDSAPDLARAATVNHHEVLHMKSKAATKEVILLILKRKYVELLLQKQLRDALETFQQQILPSYELSESETQELAMLLLCSDKAQMMARLISVPLDDAELLNCIEARVSSDDVVPYGCLRHMVQWEKSDSAQVASFAHTERVDIECIALLLKHTHEVLDVAFSPDGKWLASVSEDAKIIIWGLTFTENEDEKTGAKLLNVHTKSLQVLQCADGCAPECIAWSPDSRSLLSGGGQDSNVIQLWDPSSGRCTHRFQHPAESVTTLRWLPDGRQFLSGSVQKSLVLWNTDDAASIAYQWGGRRALDMAVHPDGDQVFVLCSETELRVYNLVDKSDKLLLRADHLISSITMSPSSAGFLLLNFIEHEELACLSVATDTIVSRQRGFKQKRYILRPCFAGVDDELVVSGSEDGALFVWRREDGLEMCVDDSHSSVVNTVASHPVHRNIIATASDDETVRLWRLSSA